MALHTFEVNCANDTETLRPDTVCLIAWCAIQPLARLSIFVNSVTCVLKIVGVVIVNAGA